MLLFLFRITCQWKQKEQILFSLSPFHCDALSWRLMPTAKQVDSQWWHSFKNVILHSKIALNFFFEWFHLFLNSEWTGRLKCIFPTWFLEKRETQRCQNYCTLRDFLNILTHSWGTAWVSTYLGDHSDKQEVSDLKFRYGAKAKASNRYTANRTYSILTDELKFTQNL